MFRNFVFAAFAAALAVLTAMPAQAHHYKLGDLEIGHPAMRATLPNQPVAGGFMTITNNGTEPDRLISIEVDFAGQAQIHEMKMEGEIMKMRQIEGGLEIPAGATVKLEPGGLHIMFMQLEEAMKEGDSHKATLNFEKAGSVEVEFKVEAMKPDEAAGHADHGKDQDSGHSGHGG